MKEEKMPEQPIRPECEHRLTKLEDAITRVCDNDIPHIFAEVDGTKRRGNQILAGMILLLVLFLATHPQLFQEIWSILKRVF
jgi:hypothetical protein